MDEVEGAVDGVDDEGGRVGDLGGAGNEGFFADEGVGGVEGGEAGGDEGFDGAVGGGYEVRGWGGLVMSEGWGGGQGGRTVHLGVDGNGGGVGGEDHGAGLEGEGDKIIVDLFEVGGVGHVGRWWGRRWGWCVSV